MPDRIPSTDATRRLSMPGGFSLGFIDASIPITQDGDGDARREPPPAFVLKELIGKGGQGEVWEAWQSSLGREIAVKIHRDGSAEAFLHEALLTAELDHPNIVPVLDVGTLAEGDGAYDGAAVMAMKRVRGVRWDELIRRELQEHPTHDYLVRHLGILRRVCHAVFYAHSRGIVHLDLKPSQVIVGEFGEVYLMDWGMAARLLPHPLRAGRCVGDIHEPFGTPAYMAPEQALGDGPAVSVRTDVYLLGATTQHVLTGKALRRLPTVSAMLESARRNEILPLPSAIPRPLARLLDSALAARPADRPASAEAFGAALDAFLGEASLEREAEAILADALNKLEGETLDYRALGELERKLDRARAIAPLLPGVAETRDRALALHGQQALTRGDLELARLIAERLDNPEERAALRTAVEQAQQERQRVHEQRVRARRGAFTALGAMLVVLGVSSALLHHAYRAEGTQRERAEGALRSTRRAQYRANIIAAHAHVMGGHHAEARSTLAQAPEEYRGWEWQYLGRMAEPEHRMILDRGERYPDIAQLGNSTAFCVIRPSDGALMFVDVAKESEPIVELAKAGSPWTRVYPVGDSLLSMAAAGYMQMRKDATTLVGQRAPDRELLATSGYGAAFVQKDGLLMRWGVMAASKPLGNLKERATALAISADGKVMVGTETGGLLEFPAPGEPLARPAVHRRPVRQIAWNLAGDRFATISGASEEETQPGDARVLVWQVGVADPIAQFSTNDYGPSAVAWAENGGLLLVGDHAARLHALDTATWQVVASRSMEAGIPFSIGVNDEMDRALARSRNAVVLFEPRSLVSDREVRIDTRRLYSASLVAGGFVASGEDGGVGLWGVEQEHVREYFDQLDRTFQIEVAYGADRVLTVHRLGSLMVHPTDQATLTPLQEAWSPTPPATATLSPNGEFLVSAGEAGSISVLRLGGANPVLLGTWPTESPIRAIAFSPDNRTLHLIDQLGRLLRAEIGVPAPPAAVAEGDAADPWTTLCVSSDRVFLGRGMGVIEALDASNHRIVQHLSGHRGSILRLRLSTDGNHLVSASADETARLWNVQTGESEGVFRGSHGGAVTSAVLTPDGRRVITGCADSVVRIFEQDTGVELLALADVHRFGILDLALARDGRQLYTAGRDGYLKMLIPRE